MNRDEERHMKMLNNKSSTCNIRFDNTYPLYKYNIIITLGIEIKRAIWKFLIIKVVNVILHLMTLTSYTSTIQV